MSSRLSPAKREELMVSAYELSLEGHTFREIGRRLGLSHSTISEMVRTEAEKRRKSVDLQVQRLVDMNMKAVNRLWEELNRNPSGHATANLVHALRGLLQDIGKLSGATPPSLHYHKVDVKHSVEQMFQNWYGKLNSEELEMLMRLIAKIDESIPPDVCVVEGAVRVYRERGALQRSLHDTLHGVFEHPQVALESSIGG
jgi:DNA-binding MarR family transcriptional regulator